MADVIYNSYKKDQMNGSIDLDTDTIYVMLVTSSYTPNQDSHSVRNDVTNEVSGTGYTAGGAEITNKQVTQDDTDDEGVFDGADVTWGTSTITARGAVIYKSTGAITTDNLIAYIDFGADKSSSAGDFTIQWSTEGIINLTG
jgi:hypothetical protein